MLKIDRYTFFVALSQKIDALIFATNTMEDDRIIVFSEIGQYYSWMHHTLKELIHYFKICLEMVNKDGITLSTLPVKIKSNCGIFLAKVSQI